MEIAETSRDQTATAANRATAQRLARAMRERDYATLEDTFAADVVLNSPITGGFRFCGREDVIALLRIVREAMHGLEHGELIGAGDVWTQRFSARVGGRAIDAIDLVRFDAAGNVREFTVFVRPLPGVAAFTAAVAPGVGRRRGRLTSIVLRLLTGPLAVITRQGDRFAAWLLRGTWGAGGAG